MARRSREAAARVRRLLDGPTIQCGSCGLRFWTYEQMKAHYGMSTGKSYCQHVVVGPQP